MSLANRHGLRRSEAVAMRWEDINFQAQEIFIRRAKGSLSGAAPLWKDELNALRKYQRESGDRSSGYVWMGRNKQAISGKTIYYLITELGTAAGMIIHPHQLRHSCGYHLINQGHDLRLVQQLLGHKQVNNTIRYTQLAAGALRKLVD
ncbi:MAG: phage integrase family protein [Okeania sp. SIO3I5]|uniref:tyrosine-type recombinase/integrase n=1 Tax=Okeania sp. SIO3I5 TaxID=2607805 RepID=UPI0013B5E140|nr:tyrosine-type recombinase/integrase [Okeania sp. SIO3I5]NEQ38458.1 phage integrase family protein [Okeania sp. SIO3I5]